MSEPTITKTDIKSKSAGFLQWDLFVVTTTPTGGLGPVMANLPDHLKFQVGIEQNGTMVAAGPLWADDEETWNGEGCIIIRAPSLAKAREIMDSDPMHASGARSYAIRPWMVNEGSMSMRVTFSDQRTSVS